MNLTIEPTGKIVEIHGEQVPLWHGTTERGNQIRFVIVGVTGPDSAATTQLLKTVPMHGLQSAPEPLTELLALLDGSALTVPPPPTPAPAEAPTTVPPGAHPAPATPPVARRKAAAKRPAQRTTPEAGRAPRQKLAREREHETVAAPAEAPRPPRVLDAPRVQGPARALRPAPAEPTTPITTNPALLNRLTQAVELLDGRGRRGDAHDKQQARQLLRTHPDKLHLIDGASKYAGMAPGEEAEALLD